MAKRKATRDSPQVDLQTVFLERLWKIVPESAWESTLEALRKPRVVGFRINTLKADVADVLSRLAADGFEQDPKPVDWSPVSFWLPAEFRERLTHSPLVSSGEIYIQGLSSQLASVLLDPQPGEMILDLAAAPGGKTCHIAALMKNQGTISAVEPIRDRFFRLRATLARNGVTIAKTYQTDGRSVGRKTGPRFDRVLLDAPCSAEARIRLDDPDSFRYWSPRKIRESARKQRGLIESAFTALKPAGRLVYCTCTFAPEENEEIVAGLLETFSESAGLESISLDLSNLNSGLNSLEEIQCPDPTAQAVRLFPTAYIDAFYFASIRKIA